MQRQIVDNLQIDLFAGFLEGDGQAETVGQRGQLLDGVRDMQVGALTVGEILLDQMTAVAGRIDREVCGTCRDTAFEDCLESSEVVVVTAEGKVVDKEDKLERVFAQLVDQVRDFVQLALFDFDQPQTAGSERIGDRLDGRGLAGAGIAVEQGIGGGGVPRSVRGCCR